MRTKAVASPPKSKIDWRLWSGVMVVLVIAYYFYGGSSAPTSTLKAAAPASKKSGGVADTYLPIDRTVKFPILTVSSKDAFLPLIRKPVVSAAALAGDLGLPPSLTGGGSWSYDGMVTVNGKVQGLLDETKTGVAEFVSLGQRWKKARIKRITDKEMVLQGDNGTSATLKMGDSSGKTAAPASAAPPANAPVAVQPPALSGAIGALDVTPLPDPNASPGGRRRRNRNFNQNLGQ